MIMASDIKNFKIDEKSLKIAHDNLVKKDRNVQEEKELFYLSTFINDKVIASSITSPSDNFRINYISALTTLHYQYFDYLNAIFEFYQLFGEEELELSNYENIVHSYENVFASVHDFYYSLDKDWFSIFNKLYKERHSTIELTSNRSFSVLFPCSKLWISNIEAKGTIEDYVNIVHEYAHGIDDLIANRVRTYSPQNIFLELFPTVCQMIYLKNNNDIRNQIEVNKFLTNFQEIQRLSAEEIKIKFNLVNAFPDVNNARSLSRLIKKHFGQVVSKEYLTSIFSKPVEEDISYVYPFIIALELVALYNKDQELFKYKMNYILTSKEYPLEVIKKLKIVPNNIKKMN